MKRLLIHGDNFPVASRSAEWVTVRLPAVKQMVAGPSIFKHAFRYAEVELLLYRLEVFYQPLVTALAARILSRGPCRILDRQGRHRDIDFRFLIRLLADHLSNMLQSRPLLRRIRRTVDELVSEGNNGTPQLGTSAPSVYLRTDLVYGLASGGSVGHIAGVLNNLDSYAPSAIFISTDTIPLVRSDIETHIVVPQQVSKQMSGLRFNEYFYAEAQRALQWQCPAFIYQRYSLNNYSGIQLSRQYQVPFVLEYNGSELWISRHWGKRLKYEALSEKIELLNLHAAHVVVVVSQPMRDELVGRGVEADKILVNPNGVEPDKYSPDVDGSRVRSEYGFGDSTVLGFIGTFGNWHGAEVLAEAFGRLLRERPDYRDRVRLLMIGDGATMHQVRHALEKHGVTDRCVLTGIIPQEEGPEHLAACDVLMAPHVPNADGTPFFGSPTKLFEYMAMGKGIVASDLDQIGEILEHDRTAWLVQPGSIRGLMDGMQRLIDDPGTRVRLGIAARKHVVARYTWREHTRRIVEKLTERCG